MSRLIKDADEFDDHAAFLEKVIKWVVLAAAFGLGWWLWPMIEAFLKGGC